MFEVCHGMGELYLSMAALPWMEVFHGEDGLQEGLWNSGGITVDRGHAHKRHQLDDQPHSQTSQNHPLPVALLQRPGAKCRLRNSRNFEEGACTVGDWTTIEAWWNGYRRVLFKVISIANLWVLSRMWSVFSLLVTFLMVPRNYCLSTPLLGFLGIYTPLQWSSEDVSYQIEIKFDKKYKNRCTHWGRTRGIFHIPACVG